MSARPSSSRPSSSRPTSAPRALPVGRTFAVLVGLVLAGGCERIVEVEIEAGERRLVVEGRIELVKQAPPGLQTIRLTTTDAFFSNRAAPPATGATVTVTSGSGVVSPFVEAEPGLYVTGDLLPEIGEVYTLSVGYLGDAYRASAELRPVAPIDSLYFIFEEKTIIIEEEGFRAAIDYADPPGERNFYLWEQLVDGVNIIPPDPGNAFNLVSEDEFYDGQAIIGFQPNDEVAIQPGQHAEVRQIALSPEAHDYYYALFEQNALGSGNPFSIPPASVRGNVENRTRPDRFALGFFEAAEVSRAEGIAPDG